MGAASSEGVEIPEKAEKVGGWRQRQKAAGSRWVGGASEEYVKKKSA